ncbi:MAG: lipocalin family protein [Bacteroidales bacterium]
MKTLALLSICFLLGGIPQNENIVNTVKDFELHKYLGKWYEIARFDHKFEKNLENVTADYSLVKDGKIKVVNTGYNPIKDKISIANGKAKQPNLEKPAQLKVSFFLWFYADYNILELDTDNYSYALVGSKSDKYLWILSRTPKLNEKIKIHLLEKAKILGYDTSKLIWVKHAAKE